jgi:FlaA1/EpsC-like NDP-sugar epimerase
VQQQRRKVWKKNLAARVVPVIPTESAGLLRAFLDVTVWMAALLFAAYLRLDFTLDGLDLGRVLQLFGFMIVVQGIAGYTFSIYRRRWRYGSIDEVGALIRTAAITTTALFIADYFIEPRFVPLSSVIGGGFVGLVGMAGIRYIWRQMFESGRVPTSALPTIVFGAGEAGAEMVRSFLRNPTSPYLPVAILDDSPVHQRQEVARVSVEGTQHDMETVMRRYDARVLLIAIPSASPELLSQLSDRAADLALTVKILPPVSELFGETPGTQHIRDLTEADLMGRHEIKTDVEAIAQYLTGKRVLVTGAGGSIGSELCRQIARFAPEKLLMLDRDETALHSLQLSIEGRALLDSPNLLLNDIRDVQHLKNLFTEFQPQVVFHAAALKHLSLLEMHPGEALKSNVWGTQNVLDAAETVGVERFVNISTDKAANPTSVLGYSKRLAERLTAQKASTVQTGTYVSVRFGNVLGSRGSMLPAFKEMIAKGGPVTVTHPDVTRFFMTIPEAVQLVINAGAIGKQGEVLVLDMGEPVKIDEVARRLIKHARRPDVDVVYTGLRPGEKLHEDLFGDDEPDVRPIHPLISHSPVPPIRIDDLSELDPSDSREHLVLRLRAACVMVGGATSPASSVG